MRFLLRILFIFVALFGVMSLIRGALAPDRSGAGRPSPQDRERTGKLMKDPVCGTYVPAETALTARSDSGTHYFCSEECRRKFLAETHAT